MNVLLTGSTAAQVSSKKNDKTITFTGLVAKALDHGKNNVTWVEPSVFMSREYIAEFDSVIVGLAPPTSTAAHRIYGSLSVIHYAQEIGNLRLLIDAPEPYRIWAGLNAIVKRPEDLIKDFYSKRSEYVKAHDRKVFERIYQAVEFLNKEYWPKTYYPRLPWNSFSSVSSYIQGTDSKNLVGLSFDKKIFEKFSGRTSENYSEIWVADSPNSSWTKRQEKLVNYPVVPLKKSRWEGDDQSIVRLSDAIGCLVSVYRGNDPWWSPAIAQSLSVGVPVISDWLLTSMLGNGWDILPAAVEEMSHEERKILAKNQMISYAEALLPWDDSVRLLCASLVD
jgi:hypothetical protein